MTCGIYGSKGSGKTTFLLTLAQTITCDDPITKKYSKETVIWRGRGNDYWNWIPPNLVHIFIHKADFNRAIFKNDEMQEIPRSELPPMEPYTSIRELHSKLRLGKINVVYEPTTYTISDRIKKLIQRRGVTGDDLFKSSEVDPVIFWFEVMDWMVHNKNPRFVSIIFDEADELFPSAPSGARWHLNMWAKDIIKDLRRRRISLFMACHGYQDLDGRIKPKIQYKVWMRGSVTMPESLINRRAPIMLEPGVYYIERDGWGVHSFEKIQEKTIMLTYLNGEDDRDDFGDDDIAPPKLPAIPKPAKGGEPAANGMMITDDCIRRDGLGNIVSIDLTKLNGGLGLGQLPIKKKRSARKKAVYHKRSYILKRSTDNDNKVEQAKEFDAKVESGLIEEPKVPKPDRNDLTTDEVDK